MIHTEADGQDYRLFLLYCVINELPDDWKYQGNYWRNGSVGLYCDKYIGKYIRQPRKYSDYLERSDGSRITEGQEVNIYLEKEFGIKPSESSNVLFLPIGCTKDSILLHIRKIATKRNQSVEMDIILTGEQRLFFMLV